jgi:replicative DNA helicase
MGMLNAYLDSLEQVEKFKPDLLIVDYLMMMHLDMEHLRFSMGAVARSLRGLATVRNCAVITAAQANREAANRKWVRGTDVAEDWSLVGTADTFLTYSQTDAEHELHVARLLVEKARNGRDKWSVYIAQTYETGQFCIDSAYGSGQLKDQLLEGDDKK